MSEFNFGRTSRNVLKTVNDDPARVMRLAITLTKVDFGITAPYGGYRSAEMQKKMYDAGKSALDGYKLKSHHQSGNAVDVHGVTNGRTDYSAITMHRIAAAVLQAAAMLGVKCEWGGLWDSPDMPHFQFGDDL